MGLLDIFKPSAFYVPATSVDRRASAITGLWWQEPRGSLTQIVIDDIFGDMPEVIDRAAAMTVPPVARGRHLLVGSIADLPLVDYVGQTPLPDEQQPPWLYRTNGVSPWHRMAWTIDDLIFNDASLWWRSNNSDGTVRMADRIPFEDWHVEDRIIDLGDGRGDQLAKVIIVNEQIVDASEVIYIPGPGGGLLTDARVTLRGSRQMEKAWVARTRSPIPPTLFEQTEQDTAEQDDVDNLVATWGAARGNPETAGTAFVPYGLKAVFPPVNDDSQLFIEGRNGVRLDIANHLNIPASLLDGSTATASLTYVTAEGQRSSFHEQSLRFWTAPIEHRLSMDDIVPRGQRIRFDITYTTQQAPSGEAAKD